VGSDPDLITGGWVLLEPLASATGVTLPCVSVKAQRLVPALAAVGGSSLLSPALALCRVEAVAHRPAVCGRWISPPRLLAIQI